MDENKYIFAKTAYVIIIQRIYIYSVSIESEAYL